MLAVVLAFMLLLEFTCLYCRHMNINIHVSIIVSISSNSVSLYERINIFVFVVILLVGRNTAFMLMVISKTSLC